MLLSLMLVFGTVLTFVSCGGTTTECTEHKDENGDGICDTEGCGKTVENTPDIPTDAVNENGEVYLFKGGVPTFQFVIGTSEIAKQKSNIEELAELLVSLSAKGSEIKTVAQNEGDPMAVEILIGTVTNRGDDCNINKYDYGNTGYIVKQIGTKIVVTGGSETALTNAIKYLKETVFGIKRSNENFTDFVMAADKAYDTKQDNYNLKDITIAGNSIKDYVITYTKNDAKASESATDLQESLYTNCGIYLDVKIESSAEGMKKIAIRNIENDGKGDGFYVKVDSDSNLVIECEYAGKSSALIGEYFKNNVFNKRNSFTYAKDYSYSKNYRDIYYADFGAKGNGSTDDFFAIKAAHDEANEYLLNVHADPNATYYIGNANGSKTITVKTNTYFHGCKFIFDDEGVAYNSAGREVPIFTLSSDSRTVSYNKSTTPITSLEAGAKNVGWAPGRTVMIAIYQNDIRHYIRYGTNASQSSDPTKWGQGQHELLLIDAEGNVDPSTPVQWTYTAVTSMTLYYVDDRPIEVKGEGDDGRRTTVTTWYNDGPNAYWYYYRNFQIMRSNVTLSGIEHVYDKYTLAADGGQGCPYNGFVAVRDCSNVTVDNMIYECPPGYKDSEPINRPSSSPTPTHGGMGSYEISAALANNVTWSNSTQSNFFQENGGIAYDGNMGTNFCKNLTFDNIFNCSFDAHCGVYNGTIKNSTLEHINFIGDGLITLENVTLYADANHAAINLREDYGSTWAGDINIDGLTFKVNQNKNDQTLHIVKAIWNNWFFGYTTYLPQHITVKNMLVAQYTYTLVGEGNGTNNRVEGDSYIYNALPVRAFPAKINESETNIGASMIGIEQNQNPMVATKEIRLYTTYTGKYAELGIKKPINFIAPTGEYFKNLQYYVDDVLTDRH